MRPVTSPTARRGRALLQALVVPLLLALLGSSLASPASAATKPRAPGDGTVLGFDTCVAPSTKVMDAWMQHSPYQAVGIYVSGNSRYCGEKYQTNLSKSWVQHNADNGWSFLPIHVGYQSPCFKNNPKSRVQKKKMSTNLTTARKQGAADAKETIAALQRYGLPKGSVSYLDIEWYSRTRACDDALLAFSDAWTETLHAAGYRSGVYSSGSAAIKLVDEVRAGTRKASGFTNFDHVWFAWTNKVADVDGGPYLADTGWKTSRVHQFHNNVTQTYGGHQLTIDRNVLRTGGGSVASTEPRSCGVSMTLASYPTLKPGDRGDAVKALQCLLKEQGLKKTVTGGYGSGTIAGVNRLRATQGWQRSGLTTRPVWTALHARGSTAAVTKYGDVGASVWRLQRSLRAAGFSLTVTGVVNKATVAAVQQLRRENGQSALETVTSSQWSLLKAGRTAKR